ncbi:MAG: 2-dehydropantoate 2-reductase [Pseudomonadota bacterium]
MITQNSDMSQNFSVAVLGAGAIGCIVGGFIAEMGLHPVLIGRAHVLDPLSQQGLSFEAGNAHMIRPVQFGIATSPEALAEKDVIFVATKATALQQVVTDIKAHGKPDALIVCLLNGISPVRFLQAALPDHKVLAGMVPFNVVWLDDVHLQQSSLGKIELEAHKVTNFLRQRRPEWFDTKDTLDGIQNGKLLLNLINPVNALSGLPLVKMLASRGYRLIYADAVAEALVVYKAAGLSFENQAALPMPLTLKLLKGPNWLVKALVISRQKLGPHTMTSMAQDYSAQRPTEIDFINGEIVALGQSLGVPTPVNSALVNWVQRAPERRWPNPSPEEIRASIGQ